jgi:UDP-N-acetylmuramate: L-alanyl-gamma-D-glutamyl-meso-diaminopimelate ligase
VDAGDVPASDTHASDAPASDATRAASAAHTPQPSGAATTTNAAAHPTWTARDIRYDEDMTRFVVLHEGREWGVVETPLAGAYNVRNCLAAIAAAHAIGADPGKLREALRTFRSVRRRMELRGVVRGVTVIDDFAHHPTAVEETLRAARQRYSGRRIVAVFEPRSYTAQRREFQEPYTRALAHADEIVLAGLFHPERYTRQTALDPDEVVASLRTQGRTAAYVPEVDRIVERLAGSAGEGDVIVIMSNGGFGGIHDKLLAALDDHRTTTPGEHNA